MREWNAEVRATAQDSVAADELRALVPGDRVAWTLCTVRGITDGLSAIHLIRDAKFTLCEEEIPAAVRRLPGNQRSIENLGLPPCRACIAHATANLVWAS